MKRTFKYLLSISPLGKQEYSTIAVYDFKKDMIADMKKAGFKKYYDNWIHPSGYYSYIKKVDYNKLEHFNDLEIFSFGKYA